MSRSTTTASPRVGIGGILFAPRCVALWSTLLRETGPFSGLATGPLGRAVLALLTLADTLASVSLEGVKAPRCQLDLWSPNRGCGCVLWVGVRAGCCRGCLSCYALLLWPWVGTYLGYF